MTSINTNLGALAAISHASQGQRTLQKSIERISSGLRILSAADDAAGLSIANKISSEILGMETAIKNSANAISLIDTALGGTGEGIKISQRIRELAVQMSSGTYSRQDRENAQFEINDLILEIDRISSQTTFNNIKLLDGTFRQSMMIGNTLAESLTIEIDNPLSLTGIAAVNEALGVSESVLAAQSYGAGTSNFLIPSNSEATLQERTEQVFGNSEQNLEASSFASGTSTLNYLENTVGTGSSAFDTPDLSDASGTSTIDFATYSNVSITPKQTATGNYIARGTSNLDIDATSNASGSSWLNYLATSEANELSSIAAGVPLNSTAEIAAGGASTLSPAGFFNGTFNGQAVTSTPAQSGGTVSIDGWDIHLEQVALGPVAPGTVISSTIGGFSTPPDEEPIGSSGDDSAASATPGNTIIFSTEVANNSITLATNEIIAPSHGSIHGPYVVSQEPISLNATDVVSFTWEATGQGGDVTDVYAYLLNVSDGSTITLLDFESDGAGAVSPQTINYELQTGQNGLYKFVFISGSNDGDGGGIVGSEVKLSNVIVQENSNASTTTTASVTLEAQETQNLRISRSKLAQLDSIALDNSYTISGDDAAFFSVDPLTGDITAGPILRSTKASYNFDIRYNRPGGGYHIEKVTLNLTPALAAQTSLIAQESNRVNIGLNDLSMLKAYYDANKGGVFSLDPTSTDFNDFSIDPQTGAVWSKAPLDYFTKSVHQFNVLYEVEGVTFTNYVTLNVTDTLTSSATLYAREANAVTIDPAILVGTNRYMSENGGGSFTLSGADATKFSLVDGKYVSNNPLLLADQETYNLELRYLALSGAVHTETITLHLTEALTGSSELKVTSNSIAEIEANTLQNISLFASGGSGTWRLQDNPSAPTGDHTGFSINPQTGNIVSNSALASGTYVFDVVFERDSDHQTFVETVTLNAQPATSGIMTIKAVEADQLLVTHNELLSNIGFYSDNPNASIVLSGADQALVSIDANGNLVSSTIPHLNRLDKYNLEERYDFNIEFSAAGRTHVEAVQLIITESLSASASLTAHEGAQIVIEPSRLIQLNAFAGRDRYRGSYKIDATVLDGAFFTIDANGAIRSSETLDFDDRSNHQYNFVVEYTGSDNRIFYENVTLTLTDTYSSNANIYAEEGVSLAIDIGQLTSSSQFKANKPGGQFFLSGADANKFNVDPTSGKITSKSNQLMTRDIAGVFKDTYNFNLEYRLPGTTTHIENISLKLTEALQATSIFTSAEADLVTVYLDSLTKIRSFASRDGVNGNFKITGQDADLFEFSANGNIQSARPLLYSDRNDHSFHFNVEYTESASSGSDTFSEAVTLTLTDSTTSNAIVYATEGDDIEFGLEILTASANFADNHPAGTFTLSNNNNGFFVVDPVSGTITLSSNVSLLRSNQAAHNVTLDYNIAGQKAHSESITLNLLSPLNAVVDATAAEANQITITTEDLSQLNLFVRQHPNGRYNITGLDANFFEISEDGIVTTKEALDYDARRDHKYEFNVVYTDDNSLIFNQVVNLYLTDTFQSEAMIFVEEAEQIAIELSAITSSSTFKQYKRGGQFTLGGQDAAKFYVDRLTGLITSRPSQIIRKDIQENFQLELIYTLPNSQKHTEKIAIHLTKTKNNEASTSTSVIEAGRITINANTLNQMQQFAKSDGYRGMFKLLAAPGSGNNDHLAFSIDEKGNVASKTETVIDYEVGQRSFQFQAQYHHSDGSQIYRDNITIEIVNDPIDDNGEIFSEVSVRSANSAAETVTQIDKILSRIIATESELGATKNALKSNIDRLSYSLIGSYSAKGRITDVNQAEVIASLAKTQMLNQAALAVIHTADLGLKRNLSILLTS